MNKIFFTPFSFLLKWWEGAAVKTTAHQRERELYKGVLDIDTQKELDLLFQARELKEEYKYAIENEDYLQAEALDGLLCILRRHFHQKYPESTPQ